MSPVVSARQISATLHSNGELRRVGVRVQAGQQGEADGGRTLGGGGCLSNGGRLGLTIYLLLSWERAGGGGDTAG